jgi:hypothetical protein
MKRQQMSDRMAFYAPNALGKTRAVTPEGFLLCSGVAIARTGTQIYGAAELGLDPDADGQIKIQRVPEEVFREETLASFEGKPVTVEHPNEFVSPHNWNQIAVGVVQNVRRGKGIEDDLLLADLLITSADAIEYVNREMPELSAGYEADYEQTAAGHGIQRNIVGNHVALVERGRAGPRVSIKDEDHTVKNRFMDRLMKLLKAAAANDEEKMQELVSGDSDEEGLEGRFKKLEDWMKDCMSKDEAEEKEKKEAKDAEEKAKKEAEEKARDSLITAETASIVSQGKLYTGDSLKEIVARAEILAPGVHVPTMDSSSALSLAPALMVKALETADATEAGKTCIAPFLMGRELKKLTGDALLGVFNGAAELMRVRNNQQQSAPALKTRDFGAAPKTPDEINAANAAFWAHGK